jgi:hypothetical protein
MTPSKLIDLITDHCVEQSAAESEIAATTDPETNPVAHMGAVGSSEAYRDVASFIETLQAQIQVIDAEFCAYRKRLKELDGDEMLRRNRDELEPEMREHFSKKVFSRHPGSES